MDTCVRCLRDGAAADALATAVLLLDEVDGCHGGDAVFDQMLLDLSQAISEGRSLAQQLHAVAVDRPPSELVALGAASVTDLFTNPCGWVQPQQLSSSNSSSSSSGGVRWSDLHALQAVCETGLPLQPGHSRCCLAVAGLSTLLQRHSSMQVLQVLHKLRACPQVSSMLLSVHQDLHPPQVTAALQELSTAILQLQPVPGLQQQLAEQATGKPCHGQLSASIKRPKSGRLRSEQQLFSLLPAGGVDVYAAPQGVALDARALVETALGQQQQQVLQAAARSRGGGAAAGAAAAAAVGGPPLASSAPGAAAAAAAAGPQAAAEDALAKRLSSSMRLDTSEQERAAKAAVQLPYQHQGAGKTYEAGDARQYLPPAAGGVGPGVEAPGGRLGHILYVRDSDEEHDSDEDPDDDLDV